MSTETIKSKAYRILVGNGLWDRISFWSKAADTEAADGKNLETKVGAVDGITSDVSSTSTNYAASIKTVHDLNANLTADNNVPFRFGYDSVSQKYGYYVEEAGTDVLVPFSFDFSNCTKETLYEVGQKNSTASTNVGTNSFSTTLTMTKNGILVITISDDYTTHSSISLNGIDIKNDNTYKFAKFTTNGGVPFIINVKVGDIIALSMTSGYYGMVTAVLCS